MGHALRHITIACRQAPTRTRKPPLLAFVGASLLAMCSSPSRHSLSSIGLTATVEFSEQCGRHGGLLGRKDAFFLFLGLPLQTRIGAFAGAETVGPGHAGAHHLGAQIHTVDRQTPDLPTIRILPPIDHLNRLAQGQVNQSLTGLNATRLTGFGRIHAFDAQPDRLLLTFTHQHHRVAIHDPADPAGPDL